MLTEITRFNQTFDPKSARNVLIVYQEEKMFIGDTYILINQLSACQHFFPQAGIDINCSNKKHAALCGALLKNNPFIRHFTNQEIEEPDYTAYDLICCIMPDETQLLQLLEQKYADVSSWSTAVYSMTGQFINRNLNGPVVTVFPSFKELVDKNGEEVPDTPRELYISGEEKNRADEWLKQQGLKEHERLFIILDSTSDREKLMNMDVYQDVLMHLLEQDAVKVLIYDELGVGKESFYRTWIGEEKLSKMIFATKLGLRKDLCLLSHDQTRLILGPCTGLMHCADGIYSYFVRTGMPATGVPAIITYTGKYLDEKDTPANWWYAARWVQCLIVRNSSSNVKEVVTLHELSESEKQDATHLLPCKDYTAEMLIRYLPATQQAIVI